MRLFALALAVLAIAAPVFSKSAPVRPSTADSFGLGTGGDTLCRAEATANDPAAAGLFDRAYAIVCRDAVAPVGHLYALRSAPDAAARIAHGRGAGLVCEAPHQQSLAEAGSVAVQSCRGADGVTYMGLQASRGRMLYAAQGLSGYRSALELGLRTIIADRQVAGSVTIALTDVGDRTSFARAQAGSLDPALALTEGYRRNNSGSYAEAAEFFDALVQEAATTKGDERGAEYLLNRALQVSDLGSDAEADALFAEADQIPTRDSVTLRMRRNYAALNDINQGRLDQAWIRLRQPLAPITAGVGAANEIDSDTALALNDSLPLAHQLGVTAGATLTPAERVGLLDAQATLLQATVLRHRGDRGGAAEQLKLAASQIAAVRGGRVASARRLDAEVLTEQAALAESGGSGAQAETLLRDAAAITAAEYPDSVALDAAHARLAGSLARHGKIEEALATYRAVAIRLSARGGATGAFAGLLEPYFALLVQQLPAHPALGDDLFFVSGVLLRPGVADTQATLARQLSGGSGEAARIFRQSLNEAREAQALRVQLARLLALPAPTDQDKAAISADRTQLGQMESEQSATQARLSSFPAYRAITTQALTLADLRAVLHPGEAYWQLLVVDRSIFALYVTPDGMRAWALPIDVATLARHVDQIRSTIASVENGHPVTYPFDAAAARQLYLDLAGPIASTLPQLHHLIFEPDGAMLRLPITLLIDRQEGLDRYLAGIRDPAADAYDMRGVDWLGAHVEVSTALSARAFRDLRATPASTATHVYLGFGQNAPVPPFQQLTAFQPAAGAIDCRWPLAAWSNPISAAELVSAQQVIGANQAAVVTGGSFTDTAILHRADLASYRIIHFATHGLVTAPKPQCPAEPALLTSFGAAGSDGLLSFQEIYGLQLDADLVVLSACDTAGTADVAATRAAGVTSGGGNALDGLVRAFIGAGARSVLASHWPAPDDYKATERLVSGLFKAPPGTPIGDALRASQLSLMSAAETSHPYYWAGFALIGDGARPVLPAH